MRTVSYRVRDLKNLVRESTNEFKPVLGPGVKNANKSNNEKSYNKAAKDTDYTDGGLKGDKKKFNRDTLRTMANVNPINDVPEEYKKRVEAQIKGFSSELEEKNGSDKNGNFQGNEAFLDLINAKNKEHNDDKKEYAKSGLQARELPDGKHDIKTKNLTESKFPAKRLTFKKRFINEANMLQRIPEEYKRDGQVIYMKDRFENEYIVECVKSEKTGIIETNVKNYCNKQTLNEQMNRMYSLFDFNSSKTKLTNNERINEEHTFGELMDLARGK